MRVAIVVQRYGEEVIGGAEIHARAVAEKLRSVLGWDIEVFTTTARDNRTWESEYPAGVEVINNITVRRYKAAKGRPLLFLFYHRLMRFMHPMISRLPFGWLGRAMEGLWYRLLGPYVPSLIEALSKEVDRFDRIIFFAYLFYPTVKGILTVGHKSYLAPLAHDEVSFRFQTTETILGRVRCLIGNSVPELRFISRLYPGLKTPSVTAGMGINFEVFRKGNRRPFEPPYFLYMGRLDSGKGVLKLIAWFKRAKAALGLGTLRLYLAGYGQAGGAIVEDDDVHLCGVVGDSQKPELYAGASGIINPSPLESLSILALEAMAAEKPLLLNGRCNVFQYYAEQLDTCFLYYDQHSFQAQLKHVLSTNWQEGEGSCRLRKARQWAMDRYSWDKVLAAYQSLP